MGKSARAQTSNNAKLAAIKAEQARKDRQRKVLLASGVIVVVLAVAAALVVASKNAPAKKPTSASALDPTAFKNLTTVPVATFDAVGVGSATADRSPVKVDAPALTKDGKPRVVYVGAEYCPFCASDRWALTTALSRFGTWSNLDAASSSPDDTYPSTPTVSFHGATYTSDHLSFTGYETATNKVVNGVREKLDTLSPQDQAMFLKYDAPPYQQSAGSIPFTNYGGVALSSGSAVSNDVLMGKTQSEIAAALLDPKSDVSQSVLGAANVISAQLCTLTKNQPAEVCSSAGVKAGTGLLK